jgi:hypothetical protein
MCARELQLVNSFAEFAQFLIGLAGSALTPRGRGLRMREWQLPQAQSVIDRLATRNLIHRASPVPNPICRRSLSAIVLGEHGERVRARVVHTYEMATLEP